MSRKSLAGFLLIADIVPGPVKRLIPLVRLVDQIERLFPDLEKATWIIRRGAEGYGEAVGRIVASLEANETVGVLGAGVMSAIRTDEQWFDDVFIHVPTYGIEFGVHDSSVLFFCGREEDMLAIEGCFSSTRRLR